MHSVVGGQQLAAPLVSTAPRIQIPVRCYVASFFYNKTRLCFYKMISSSDLMKAMGRGGRLVLFFKAVCVYFVAGGGAPSPSAAALKCAPVLCLLLCVLLRANAAPHPQGRQYARRVAAGLALSAAGDALLVWPQHFVAGMAAFAAAHVAYIAAFGARPRAAAAGAALYAGAVAYARCVPAPGALRSLVPAYALLLATMAWRGVAQRGAPRAGALLFLLSDALLGYSMFAGALPYSRALVMSTYYLGQLSIALSALETGPTPATVPSH